MTLAILALLALALAGLRFSDGGEGGGAVQSSGAAAGEGTASPSPATPAAPAATSTPTGPVSGTTGGAKPPLSLADATKAALAEVRGQPAPGSAAVPTPKPAADPANPFAPPPTAFDPTKAPQILSELEMGDADFEGIPPEQLPLARQLAAQIGQKWYAEKYLPAATQLHGVYQQQQQWQQQVNEICASPAFQMAGYLTQNPPVLEAVRHFLSGGGGPQNPPADPLQAALGKINPAQLDEETRTIYEINRGLVEQQTQLRQQLAEVQATAGEMQQWRNDATQEQQRAWQQHTDGQADSELSTAIGEVSRTLGFQPHSYKKEFKAACDYVGQALEAGLYRWEQGGRKGPPPRADVRQLLWQGLRAAGFEAIFEKRKRQASSGSGPPPDRVGTPVLGLRQIVAEETAKAKVA